MIYRMTHSQLPEPKGNALRRLLGVVVLGVAAVLSVLSLKAGLAPETAGASLVIGVLGAAALQFTHEDRGDPPPPRGGGGGPKLAPIPIRTDYRGL